MSLDYIRNTYRVPAQKDGLVEYSGGKKTVLGRITGARDGHILIRLFDMRHAMPFHPTWKLRYLAADGTELPPLT